MRDIEEARKFWSRIAKENGWFKNPFFVQIWVDKEGKIKDSVSFRGMTKDLIIEVE